MPRTEQEQTQVAMAMLDGMADVWFAESGFEKCDLPEPVVRMIKQAHLEGLYAGRCSNVNEIIEKCAKEAEAYPRTSSVGKPLSGIAIAAVIRKLKK